MFQSEVEPYCCPECQRVQRHGATLCQECKDKQMLKDNHIVTDAMRIAGVTAYCCNPLDRPRSHEELCEDIYLAMSASRPSLEEWQPIALAALEQLFEACRIHDPDDWTGEPAMIVAAMLLRKPPFDKAGALEAEVERLNAQAATTWGLDANEIAQREAAEAAIAAFSPSLEEWQPNHDTLVDAGFLLAAVDATYERSYGSAWVAFSDPAWARIRSAANKLRTSLKALEK